MIIDPINSLQYSDEYSECSNENDKTTKSSNVWLSNVLDDIQCRVVNEFGFINDLRLNKLFETLKLFHITLYEYGINNENIGLSEFEYFTKKERLLYLIKNSNSLNVISNIIEKGQLFISENKIPFALFDILPLCLRY